MNAAMTGAARNGVSGPIIVWTRGARPGHNQHAPVPAPGLNKRLDFAAPSVRGLEHTNGG
jgi:hypothetical protein